MFPDLECVPPACVVIACAAQCTATMPWVVWRLLVNVIATPLYFMLRMSQYQYQAECEAWIVYINTVAERVRNLYGSDISGDLSVLHTPIANSLKAYSAAFGDVKRADGRYLNRLLAVSEEGVLPDGMVAARQSIVPSRSVSTLRYAAREAIEGIQQTLEAVEGLPLISQSEIKSEEKIVSQAVHRYEGKLDRFTDVARLKFVFADCKSLLRGVELLQDALEVVAVVNVFANPTALGMRAMYLIVKVPISMRNETEDQNGFGNRQKVGVTKHGTAVASGEPSISGEGSTRGCTSRKAFATFDPAEARAEEEEEEEEGAGTVGGLLGDAVEGATESLAEEPLEATNEVFLIQIQLQLSRFEEAQQSAAVYHEQFVARLPHVSIGITKDGLVGLSYISCILCVFEIGVQAGAPGGSVRLCRHVKPRT
jgi:hypothetical protein